MTQEYSTHKHYPQLCLVCHWLNEYCFHHTRQPEYHVHDHAVWQWWKVAGFKLKLRQLITWRPTFKRRIVNTRILMYMRLCVFAALHACREDHATSMVSISKHHKLQVLVAVEAWFVYRHITITAHLLRSLHLGNLIFCAGHILSDFRSAKTRTSLCPGGPNAYPIFFHKMNVPGISLLLKTSWAYTTEQVVSGEVHFKLRWP